MFIFITFKINIKSKFFMAEKKDTIQKIEFQVKFILVLLSKKKTIYILFMKITKK